MEIGITIPLQKFLHWKKPPYGDDPRLLFCWDIHRAEISGRKLLVVVNSATRLAGVRRMTGADWKHLDDAVAECVVGAMGSIGVPEDARMRYLDAAGPMAYTKTHGRRPVAGLNRVVEDVWPFVPRDLDADNMFQMCICQRVNRFPSSVAVRKGLVFPDKVFMEELEGIIAL